MAFDPGGFDPKGSYTAGPALGFLGGLTQGLSGGLRQGMARQQQQSQFDTQQRFAQNQSRMRQGNADRTFGLAQQNAAQAQSNSNRSFNQNQERVDLEGRRFETQEGARKRKLRNSAHGGMQKALDGLGNTDLRAVGQELGTDNLRAYIGSMNQMSDEEYADALPRVTAAFAKISPEMGRIYAKRKLRAAAARNRAMSSQQKQDKVEVKINDATIALGKDAATPKKMDSLDKTIDDAVMSPKDKHIKDVARRYFGEIAELTIAARTAETQQDIVNLRIKAGNKVAKKVPGRNFETFDEMKAAAKKGDEAAKKGMQEFLEVLNQSSLGWPEPTE